MACGITKPLSRTMSGSDGKSDAGSADMRCDDLPQEILAAILSSTDSSISSPSMTRMT